MSLKKEKSDEILNLLLRGNFDYIKDESLDIDLSKCAPILPTINNSLSNFPWQLGETEFLIHTNSQCDDSTNANDMEPLLFKRNNYLTDNSVTFQSKEMILGPPLQLDVKTPIKFPLENQQKRMQQNNQIEITNQFELQNIVKISSNKNLINIKPKLDKIKQIDISKKLKQPQKHQTRKQSEPKKGNSKIVKHSKIMNSSNSNIKFKSNNLSDKRNFPLPEISINQHNIINSSLINSSSEIPLKLQNLAIEGAKLTLTDKLLESSSSTPITTNNSVPVLNLTTQHKLNDKSLIPTNFSQNILNSICIPIQISQQIHSSNQMHSQANTSKEMPQQITQPSTQVHQQGIVQNTTSEISQLLKTHVSSTVHQQLIVNGSNQMPQKINSLIQMPLTNITGNLSEKIPQENNIPLQNEKFVNTKLQKKIDENLLKSSSIKQTIMTKYKCDSCDLIFDNLSDLNTSNSHLQEHIITLICSECNKEFLNESGLKKHIKTHSNSVCRSAMMECPDCGKLLKLGSMWMHRKIHTNGKKPNITQNGKYNNEKTFECPDCGKCFPERSHMIRHQKYHTHERPFKCEKCGKMYKTERCLKVHSLVHLDQRPFSCAVCQKSFLSNSKLKQHSNIHTGERPYKCNYCSRDFTNFPNWLKHTRRRHNVDHKTGEVLQKMPKYCSKTKKKPISNKPDNDIAKNIKNEIKSSIQIDNVMNSVKLEQNKKNDIKEETVQIHEEILKANNLKLIKHDPGDPGNCLNERNFSDLHSLSITSTEDLLMEQALEMEEQAAVYFNSNQMGISSDYLDPESKLFNVLHSIESSPLSSPASDFQTYMPLPPITTVSNSFYLNSQNKNINLPSINTCFLASNNFQ